MRPEDIQVRTIMVPENNLLDWRNMMALQSAIVRGETEVLFHNCPVVPEVYWEKVRYRDRQLNKRYNFHYRTTKPQKIPQHVDDSAARRGIDDVKWKGFRFEFLEILAAGGHGYASLWRVWFEDGSSKKVVIKRSLGGNFDYEGESHFHLRYAGAEHTSQVLDLHAEAMKIQNEVRQRNPLARLRYRNGSDFNAASLELIVFEFMEHGDLGKVLTLASQMDVQFPDRTLWGIWECRMYPPFYNCVLVLIRVQLSGGLPPLHMCLLSLPCTETLTKSCKQPLIPTVWNNSWRNWRISNNLTIFTSTWKS